MTHEEYMGLRHVAPLDGFRGLAILLVFTAHPAYPRVWPHLHGATGVSFFFVLSGYLITMLLLREHRVHGTIDLRAFYLRRLFRIYPLYFSVLGLYAVLILGLGFSPERREAFVANLPWFIFGAPEHALFFSNDLPPFDGAWSIGVEEKFYLLWPFLAATLLRLRFATSGILVIVVVMTSSAVAGLAGGPWGSALAPYGLIATGCLVALLLENAAGFRLLSRLGRKPWVLIVTATVVTLQLGTSEIQRGGSGYVLYGLPVGALLTASVVTRDWLSRALQWQPLVSLGKWSYSLYLIHNFAINASEALIPQSTFLASAVSTTTAFALAVAASALLHRWLE